MAVPYSIMVFCGHLQARKLQEEVKSAALDVARARVSATKLVNNCVWIRIRLRNDVPRKTDASFTTIDLHYTTISQAIILAKEFLREYGASDGELRTFFYL